MQRCGCMLRECVCVFASMKIADDFTHTSTWGAITDVYSKYPRPLRSFPKYPDNESHTSTAKSKSSMPSNKSDMAGSLLTMQHPVKGGDGLAPAQIRQQINDSISRCIIDAGDPLVLLTRIHEETIETTNEIQLVRTGVDPGIRQLSGAEMANLSESYHKLQS